MPSALNKILLVIAIFWVQSVLAHNEILNILGANKLKLSSVELEALRPFFAELQLQYDFLNKNTNSTVDANDAEFAASFTDLKSQFKYYLQEESTMAYNTTLPSAADLIGSTDAHAANEEERLELLDIQLIIQDIIDEVQISVDDMVRRALQTEANLLKLNKSKILITAINGLGAMWNYWGRGTRAAYCTYSHVPQMTEALHNINAGVDCYKYTMALIMRVQHETEESVATVKRNIYDLARIYKKIAGKQTITGKIMSATLNLFRALRRLHDIIHVGINAYDQINNELPAAALKTAECGTDFVVSIPQMIETAQNITTCITFIDDDQPDYEFSKPEIERYWNTHQNVPEL